MDVFAISGGNLVVTGPIDYEAAASQQVTVQATDTGGLTFSKIFTISVTNVNEAPIDITVVRRHRLRRTARTGRLSARSRQIDPDAGDTATFTLTDNAGGKLRSAAAISWWLAPIDYEAAASHQVTVRRRMRAD